MYQRVGEMAMKKDLKNIKRLTKALGNPHKKFKSIHIAGTNGKGSVSHLLASGMIERGFKVGLYTSPHYKDFRERIKIGNTFIDRKAVISFVNDNYQLIEEIKPSFFEISVAMAFDYFAKQEVDVAIIETGLGGRLDSTNILKPELSIITNISFDHEAMLGDTLKKIAAEKAGIIKKKTPVIVGEYQNKVAKIFKAKAEKEKAKLKYAKVVFKKKQWKKISSLATDEHQLKNFKTASYVLYQILEKYKSEDFMDAITNLHENTFFIGRWQKLQEEPTVIVDSAHNPAGLKPVLKQIQKLNKGTLHVIMGFVNDKKLSKVLNLFPEDATYYFTKAKIPRALDPKELMVVAKHFGLKGRSYASVRSALLAAKRKAAKEDTIFVGGSIFVAAEIL